MNGDHTARLRSLKREGAKILINLMYEATPETVDSFCDEAYDWERRLLKAIKPFGEARLADFETLTPYKQEEIQCLIGVQPISSYHNEAMHEHAVRMYRLAELLRDLSHVKQKGKTGPQHIEHTEAIKTANQLMHTNATEGNKSEATRLAVEKHGRGPHASENAAFHAIRKRI